MTRHKIAILVGSLREASINRKVARSICDLAGDRLDCDMVEIGNLPLYNQDLETGSPPAAWTRFRDQVAAADAVLFVSPEYNRSMSGAIKNAIDVGSRPFGKGCLLGKPAAVVTASPGAVGGFGANHHIRQCCVALNMPVMAHPESYLGQVGDDSFGEDGLLVDGKLKDLVRKIAGAFADWVALTRA
ncbi:MAG: NADPH-dependent FMN reductase [Sphingomicrobium sp.]